MYAVNLSKWLLPVAVAMLPALAQAQADQSPEQECDALAAYSGDVTRPATAPGIEFSKIDAPHAEAVCRQAVEAHPSPRLYYRPQI